MSKSSNPLDKTSTAIIKKLLPNVNPEFFNSPHAWEQASPDSPTLLYLSSSNAHKEKQSSKPKPNYRKQRKQRQNQSIDNVQEENPKASRNSTSAIWTGRQNDNVLTGEQKSKKAIKKNQSPVRQKSPQKMNYANIKLDFDWADDVTGL
jgi:hypothetical protein